MKVYFLLLLFLVVVFTSFGQQYSFINYGVKQGLAQSQVTGVCQDNLGFLWVSTQSGLSRFNGFEFENFSVDDGLAGNTIHKLLFDDANNTLWIASLNGITKFKDNKFTPYFFKDQIKVNDLILNNDTLFIASKKGIYSFKNGYLKHSPSYFSVRQFIKSGNNDLLCATNKGLYRFLDFKFEPFEDTIISKINYSGLLIDEDNLFLSTFGHGLLKYNLTTKKVKILQTEYKRIKGVFKIGNDIWAISSQGLIQIGKDFNKPPIFFNENNGLNSKLIKCIFQDKFGVVWIGTSGKGLLKFSGKSIISYTVKDGLSSGVVMSIGQNENMELVFGTYDKGVTILKQNENIYFDNTNGLTQTPVWAIQSLGDEVWVGSSKGLNLIKDNKISKNNIVKGKIRSIAFCDKGGVYFGGKKGLWIKNESGYEHILKNIIYDINKVHISKEKLFLATKNGFFWQYLNDLNTNFFQIVLKENNCNTITTDSFGNVWVGTINGLFIISPNNDIIEYELESNFKSKNILGILKDSEGNIWLSTANGVYLLKKGNPFIKELNKLHYSIAQGLIDLECNLNAIYENNEGDVFVGTSSALFKINPKLNKDLFKSLSPQLSIQGIRLFKEKFEYKKYAKSFDLLTLVPSNIEFPFNKNHLTFDFIGLNLKDAENVEYSYRLLGAEKYWSPPSTEKSATYSFISNGEYRFQLKARLLNGDWTDIKEVLVVINPPYWKTIWFMTLTLVVLGGVVYLLLKFKLKNDERKRKSKQLEYKNRLRDLEQQSLNASMNRHFIFNSLNSIQYFINSSDKKSANKYLSSFAKLIRKNLDSSTADNFIVNLSDEVERITLYLMLEKMRFGEKFDYNVTVDDEIDMEVTSVPSMLLQPFVENSIIHGVLPLENGEKGKLEVNVKLELDYLVFEVIDNGVGVEDSLKLKESFEGDHESKGVMITENRIELLRQLDGDKLMIIGPFQINNEKGESLGTKVIIKIPINYE